MFQTTLCESHYIKSTLCESKDSHSVVMKFFFDQHVNCGRTYCTLLPNWGCVFDEKFQWNASKFAKLLTKENPKLLFPFVILCYFIFSLMNDLVYVDIDQGIPLAWNENWKKQLWVFVYIKYGKFWFILLGHFIKHKPLIFEEWTSKSS